MENLTKEQQRVVNYLSTLSQEDPKWERYKENPDQAYWDALKFEFVGGIVQIEKDYLENNFKMLLPSDGEELVNVVEKDECYDLEDFEGLSKEGQEAAEYILSAKEIAKAVYPLLVKIAKNNGPWLLEEVDELVMDFEEFMEECFDNEGRFETMDEVRRYENISVRELFESEFIVYMLNK